MQPHTPVLLAQVLQLFEGKRLRSFIDATVGAGGHATALLQAHPEIKTYFAIDQDPSALHLAKKRLFPWKDRVLFEQENFAHLASIAKRHHIEGIDGILLDIGVSSMQLDQAERGFSLQRSGPLDMRMNPDSPLTAAIIVNEWPEEELSRLFRRYGEEPRARLAARAIAHQRKTAPITTTDKLASLLEAALRSRKTKRGIHPATLVFQALRIAVNDELTALKSALEEAVWLLAPGARLAVITFHSLEDRLVKQYFRTLASDKVSTEGIGGVFLDQEPVVDLVMRKASVATEEEKRQNRRSRSAKLRAVEKRAP